MVDSQAQWHDYGTHRVVEVGHAEDAPTITQSGVDLGTDGEVRFHDVRAEPSELLAGRRLGVPGGNTGAVLVGVL